jgi:hypothetical protein
MKASLPTRSLNPVEEIENIGSKLWEIGGNSEKEGNREDMVVGIENIGEKWGAKQREYDAKIGGIGAQIGHRDNMVHRVGKYEKGIIAEIVECVQGHRDNSS